MKGKSEFVGSTIVLMFLVMLPLIMHNGFLDITDTKMWAYVILVGCYAVFSVFILIYSKKKVHNSIFTDLLIIWATIVIISCVLSEAGKFAFSGIAARNNGGFLILSYVVVALCLERIGELKKLHIYTLLIVGVMVALLGIANNFGVDPLNTLSHIVEEQRTLYVSTIGQIDIYVSFFSIVLPISIFNAWMEKRIILKVVNAFFSFIYILAMILSGCESVFITLFVMVFVYGLILARQHMVFLSLPICSVLALISFLIVNPSLLYFCDTWGNNRGFIWKQGMDFYSQAGIKDKLIGIGPDSVGLVFHWHYGISATVINGSTYDNLHNLFLQILVTTGALGLLVFLALCIVAIYNLLRGVGNDSSRGNYNIPIAVAAICYLAQSVVNISSPATLGILIVLVAIGQKKKGGKKK